MDQNSIRAMIVFSDTHLGLAEWKLFWKFENTVTSRPCHVHQFVRWLLRLENTPDEEVLVGNELGQICPKKLLSPDELVLNGDILELWDASDRAVDLDSQSIFQDLMQLSCRKVYLTGNHDFAIRQVATQEVKGSYPWGNSGLEILPDTYPKMEGEDIETVKVGENHYLILHGHQLSKTFRIAPWRIIPMLRDGAEAFRSYSWILVALLSIMLVASTFLPLLTPAIPLLAALAFPRLFVSIARPIWNYFNKGRHRYNTNPSAKGFVDWWKILLQKKKNPTSRIHIVYGHTHLMNLTYKQDLEKLVKSKIDGPDLVLINHGAWVKDNSKKYENVMQAMFLYIDAEGFEFFGWDWDRERPFHIPKQVIRKRMARETIDPQTKEWLTNLGWPNQLIKEWEKIEESQLL
jgi:hypothetical protein